MAFRVRLTAQADRDLDAILEWLQSQNAGEAGLRWFRGLRLSLDGLTDSPGRCALAPEDSEFPFEVRQLLYGRRSGTYRILFTIDGDEVVILHIRHGRRRRLKGATE